MWVRLRWREEAHGILLTEDNLTMKSARELFKSINKGKCFEAWIESYCHGYSTFERVLERLKERPRYKFIVSVVVTKTVTAADSVYAGMALLSTIKGKISEINPENIIVSNSEQVKEGSDGNS